MAIKSDIPIEDTPLLIQICINELKRQIREAMLEAANVMIEDLIREAIKGVEIIIEEDPTNRVHRIKWEIAGRNYNPNRGKDTP